MAINIHFHGEIDVVMQEMQMMLGGHSRLGAPAGTAHVERCSETTVDGAKVGLVAGDEPTAETGTDEGSLAEVNSATPAKTVDTNVPVDAAGLPWDERIHVSTKTKKKGDGCWKRIPGVDPKLVESVEAELRQHFPEPMNVEAVDQDPVADDDQTDDAETEAQDAADEKAEADANSNGKLTLDDVRGALKDYVSAFGIAATQEDGPKVFALLFGDACKKVSDIPEDQASLGKAVAGVQEMLAKNPYKREKVNG